MTTSPNIMLLEPTGTNPVPRSTIAYFRYRLKQRMFNLILKEFKKSGITKADLARRLDKEPAQVSRILSGPGNITLETVSDILFASSGAELSMSTAYPLIKEGKLNNLAEKLFTSTPKTLDAHMNASGGYRVSIEERVA